MKKLSLIFAIICLLTTFNANAQSEKINWMSFEEAVKLNETAPKKILIDVYTDWCGWCTKMDQTTFIDKDVVTYMNENYYAVKFNAEQAEPIEFKGYTFTNPNPNGTKKGTHELAQALLQGKVAYPSYVFMDENNQLLTVVPGYSQANEFLKILKFISTNAFLNTSWEEFSNE